MILQIMKMNEAVTEIVNSAQASGGNDNGALGNAAHAIGVGGQVSFWIWAILPLTVAILWYYFTKKTYEPRRHRRIIGQGPLSRIRDTVARRIGSFMS